MPIFPLLLALGLPLASPSAHAADAVQQGNVATVRFDRVRAEQLAARAWPADATALRTQYQRSLREGRLGDAGRAAAQLCVRTGESCRDAERLAGNAVQRDVIFARTAARL